MNVLDKGSRYTNSFAVGFVSAIGCPEWSSPNFYSSCLIEKSKLKDSDVNPFEDYIMVTRYFEGEEVQMIAINLDRSLKCVALRLRFLLDIRNELFLARASLNLPAANLIISALYSRYCSFRDYLKSIVYGDEERCPGVYPLYHLSERVFEDGVRVIKVEKEADSVIIDENTFCEPLNLELSEFEYELSDID